jgi:hypothetical protein
LRVPAGCGTVHDVLSFERVDFVSVVTRDIARARRFHAEIPGLPRSRETPDEFKP